MSLIIGGVGGMRLSIYFPLFTFPLMFGEIIVVVKYIHVYVSIRLKNCCSLHNEQYQSLWSTQLFEKHTLLAVEHLIKGL